MLDLLNCYQGIIGPTIRIGYSLRYGRKASYPSVEPID